MFTAHNLRENPRPRAWVEGGKRIFAMFDSIVWLFGAIYRRIKRLQPTALGFSDANDTDTWDNPEERINNVIAVNILRP